MEDFCCLICLENIENEFVILNCKCKTAVYHNKCINELIKINKLNCDYISCPHCRHIFNNKLCKFTSSRIHPNEYSLNINPIDYRPSGYIHFSRNSHISRIDDTQLLLDIHPSDYQPSGINTIRVYNINYNMLRMENGYELIQYSN
jgi:hypothetical protein